MHRSSSCAQRRKTLLIMIRFSALAEITKGKILHQSQDREIKSLIMDSRKVSGGEQALFFAIKGNRHDGHQFIGDLYRAGIRQFVVEQNISTQEFPEANFVQVVLAVQALQQMVSFHRQQYSFPVIGITGSNGKTIVKEWLSQLLSADYTIVKNPGSYNSQIGVPLSVWQMQPFHQLGIFEAGISQPHEMENLAEVIRPSMGVFTNIGSAHDEGFTSVDEKIHEKLKLFKNVEILIYRSDHAAIAQAVKSLPIKTFTWGYGEEADVRIESPGAYHKLYYQNTVRSLTIPFSDAASFENCMHCVAVMLHLNYPIEVIQKRIINLKSIAMRLELKPGINGCQIVDDSYNNDLAGLKISLAFLQGQQRKNKSLILSDIFQSGLEEKELVAEIQDLISGKGITRLVGIGDFMVRHQSSFNRLVSSSQFFPSTAEFLKHVEDAGFQNELILIKGARVFQFEKIVSALQAKVHGTVMEIDLNKIVHNLNYFRSQLQPGVKLMVMVKALAYGSGSEQIANLLQYHKVDYLGVAYADEGADLRKNQITLPIMVLNPSPESFDALLSYQLEPVIYNLKLLKEWLHFLNGRSAKMHIELDTGMHRLGFDEQDSAELTRLLSENKNAFVVSVFSHLAGADEQEHDNFTTEQAQKFMTMYEQISSATAAKPLRHILNSPGQIRHHAYQWEMVRLGIGLYGINPTAEKLSVLQPAVTLKTIVSQIKKIQKGESIGYGRKGKASEDMTIATIAIGYADGFSRSFSRGKGSVSIKGSRSPVVGNVCMDMTMVDVTGKDVKEGDEVIIFGDQLPIQEVAASVDTIPYEILTNTSDRVKRVFFAESI